MTICPVSVPGKAQYADQQEVHQNEAQQRHLQAVHGKGPGGRVGRGLKDL